MRRLLDVAGSAGGDVVKEDLLGDAPAERDDDVLKHLAARAEALVVLRAEQREAAGLTARDDRDILHGIDMLKIMRGDGVTGFVVRGEPPLLLGDDAGLLLRAHGDLENGVVNVLLHDEPAVTALSRRYDVTGVHMFCLGDGCTAYCSNYAPLYDIPEECATGTSNGALTYYLYRHGMVQPEQENVFLQGEHMYRPSEIRSRLYADGDTVTVRVGGRAVMSMSCDIKL